MKIKACCVLLIGMSTPLVAEESDKCYLQFIGHTENVEINELAIPDTFSIERVNREIVVFETAQASRHSYLVQQILNTIRLDTQLMMRWQNLSESEIRDVVAIHSGDISLVGNSAAQMFYQQMLLSFLSLGAVEYVHNSYFCDQYYSEAELQVFWEEFSTQFSTGINSDLDYAAQYAPQFSYFLAALFPAHPLIGRLLQERRIIELKAKNTEQRAKNTEQRAKNTELRAATEALRRLNETLSGTAQDGN